MTRKIKRYNEGELVGEAVGDSNEGMKEARDRDEADAEYENDRLKKRAMERSRILQQDISSGSDFKGRPQDEGYRPNAGTARERAIAEGAYDSGKITESGDQGFGGPGSSRTVKATPKAAPKAAPKAETRDTGSDVARMANRAKSVAETSNKTKSSRVPTSEQAAANRSAVMDKVKGVGASVSNYFKNFKTPAQRKAEEQKTSKGYASGGSVSSASRRADGIATKGKTRGKMC